MSLIIVGEQIKIRSKTSSILRESPLVSLRNDI